MGINYSFGIMKTDIKNFIWLLTLNSKCNLSLIYLVSTMSKHTPEHFSGVTRFIIKSVNQTNTLYWFVHFTHDGYGVL